MDRLLTLGSLFDGSGGFPLGAILTGIKPLWASEVEPFPIRVTTKRLPDVKHYGDINQLNGAKVPPVDIITGGFCCQDLSVAGKRAGLHGERSGLFFQVIRIIREMRTATDGIYPKYAILENVPGIYSSAGGADFLEVLNELIKIKGENLSIPMPERRKWSTVGEVVGDGISVAWRTLDAQFFGVAQRRRRCYIVVDFTGECAGKILFDETRLRGNPPQGCFTRQSAAGNIEDRFGNAVAFEPGACSRLGGHFWDGEPTGTLRADMGDNQTAVVYDARGNGDGETVNTITGDHENRVTDYTAIVLNYSLDRSSSVVCEDMANTLTVSDYKGTQSIFEPITAAFMGGQGADAGSIAYSEKITPTLRSQAGGNTVPMVMESVCLEGNGSRPSHRGSGIGGDVAFALNTVDRHAVCYQDTIGSLCASDYKWPQNQQTDDKKYIVEKGASNYVVRRLTPSECALLQGFPADWCAGLETPEPGKDEIAFWTGVWETRRILIGRNRKPKSRAQIIKWLRNPYSDAAEYKMWGNGVALPCVVFVLGGIVYHEQL